MKSLNTYNYREELYMKPISYQVTISENDKVIKIEEDGDLIAELSFATEGNVLYLNGKDGMEVAQVELPISLAEIVKQKYNEQTKEIELSILKTNGETVVFGLDVAELVNVYTAGDGIDISDNVISIKIKDEKGPLHVDKHGLCIDMNTIATSDDVEEIHAEITEIKGDISTLTEHVNTSINTINTNVAEGFTVINSSITTLERNIEGTNNKLIEEVEARQAADVTLQSNIDAEAFGRKEADIELQNQIGDVKGELEGSISEEINKLKEEIGNVTESLEGSITEEINKLKEEIGDVKGELEGSITEEITKIQDQLEEEASAREIADTTLQLNIENEAELRAQDVNKLFHLIVDETNLREEGDNKLLSEIETLKQADLILQSNIDAEAFGRKEADIELQNQISKEIEDRKSADITLQLNIENEAELRAQDVTKLANMIADETAARIDGDNKALNEISIEREERKAADNNLNELIITSNENLAKSIKIEKDPTNNLKYTLYVNGTACGEINIPADKMLESVVYDEETKTLTFTWNTSIQQSPTVIDISDLVDEYVAGNGLLLSGKTFSINVTDSKYISVTDNGSVEFIGKFEKPNGTSWKYDLIGSNGLNNGKVIDFTSDYEALNAHIQETYAPLTYVDEQDNKVKSDLIGAEGDAADINSIYGLRSAIAKSEEVMTAKIAEEKARAEGVEADLGNKIEAAKADVAGYVNQEIGKVNETISSNEENHANSHAEMSQNIRANSDILASLTNGESTGVVDKLDRQFHEVTRDIDENNFEGLIKSLMDRITQLESTVALLTNGSDVEGSVANMVADSLAEAKAYADAQDQVVVQHVVTYTQQTYQPIGNYITEIDAKYITEDELAAFNYVNNSTLNENLAEYAKLEYVNETFQLKGDYITEIPSEYVTANELETYHYATRDYVDEQDDKLLSREMADLLYATIDTGDKYVKTSELKALKYVNETDLENATNDMATQTWVDARYQPVGNYLTSVPEDYLTDAELVAYDFATKAYVHTQLDTINNSITSISNSKLDKVDAIESYQPKGDYVTNATLDAKDYATKTDLITALGGKADKSYVDSAINNLNIGNYVTKSELSNYNYIDAATLDAKGYITLPYLNGAIADMETKSNAASTYLTKVAFEEYTKNAFSASNIIGGDNVKVETIGTSVRLSVQLSDGYTFADTFSQNLPTSKDTLDTISQKLSQAIKELYNTTDGETF